MDYSPSYACRLAGGDELERLEQLFNEYEEKGWLDDLFTHQKNRIIQDALHEGSDEVVELVVNKAQELGYMPHFAMETKFLATQHHPVHALAERGYEDLAVQGLSVASQMDGFDRFFEYGFGDMMADVMRTDHHALMAAIIEVAHEHADNFDEFMSYGGTANTLASKGHAEALGFALNNMSDEAVAKLIATEDILENLMTSVTSSNVSAATVGIVLEHAERLGVIEGAIVGGVSMSNRSFEPITDCVIQQNPEALQILVDKAQEYGLLAEALTANDGRVLRNASEWSSAPSAEIQDILMQAAKDTGRKDIIEATEDVFADHPPEAQSNNASELEVSVESSLNASL